MPENSVKKLSFKQRQSSDSEDLKGNAGIMVLNHVQQPFHNV